MNNASNRKEIAFGMFGFLHNGAICSLFSIPFGRFVGWLVRPMVDRSYCNFSLSPHRHLHCYGSRLLWYFEKWFCTWTFCSCLVSSPGFISFIIHSASFFSAWHFCTKYQMSSGSGTKYDAPDCIHIYTQKINCFV